MIYRTYDDWKLDSGYEDDTCGDAPEGCSQPSSRIEPVLAPEIKIVTHYDPKPMPCRDFDWSAVTDNYDGQAEGRSPSSRIDDPVGYGATEKEAMIDLQMQLEDQ